MNIVVLRAPLKSTKREKVFLESNHIPAFGETGPDNLQLTAIDSVPYVLVMCSFTYVSPLECPLNYGFSNQPMLAKQGHNMHLRFDPVNEL